MYYSMGNIPLNIHDHNIKNSILYANWLIISVCALLIINSTANDHLPFAVL